MEFAASAPFKMTLTDIAILKTNATKAMEQSLVKRANEELIQRHDNAVTIRLIITQFSIVFHCLADIY